MRILWAAALIAILGCSKSAPPSPEEICKGVAKRFPELGAGESCVRDISELKPMLGEKGYASFANCVKKAESSDELKEKCAPEAMRAGGEASNVYMNKSKATEAVAFVKKLYDGVRAFAMEPPMTDSLTAPAGPRLPEESVGPTPALGSCCEQGGKCAPDSAAWEHATWVALMFSVDDPHYYSYEYKRVSDSEFQVSAYGDLDCDGEYSTYRMSGSMGADGMIDGAAKLEKTNELE